MDAIVMSGYFDPEAYERCDSLGATPVEKGSRFWQQLREALVDLLPGDEREAISRHESWDDLKQIPSTPRILIVDADPRPAELLKSRLKKFGIEVLTAEDGFHGFQVARNEMPSMIVAAHRLPDCEAEYLLWKLRSSPRTRQLPVFVMAETLSKNSQDNLKRDVGGAAGAAGFFTKPLDAEAFYPTIRTILQFRGPAGESLGGLTLDEMYGERCGPLLLHCDKRAPLRRVVGARKKSPNAAAAALRAQTPRQPADQPVNRCE